MKGHTLPGINQRGYNSAKDGKAKSAAFQHDDGTKHSHEVKRAQLTRVMGKKTKEEIAEEERIAQQAAIDVAKEKAKKKLITGMSFGGVQTRP